MKYSVLFLFLLPVMHLMGQDTLRKKHYLKELTNDLYHSMFKTENKVADSVFFQRSERAFQLYAGRPIRKTVIDKLGFGEDVLDTSTRIIGAMSRIANNLQTGTAPFIVKQFLFVRAGDQVDPFQLADNERLLRDLDFIKDARIYVRPVAGNDSVDVLVVVRDVFSFGASASASGLSNFQATLYDANLFGRAQRIEYTALFDQGRRPRLGSGILYRKYNLWGSFINLEASYTTISQGLTLGRENETGTSLRLDRPLYSPNARLAGGLMLAWNSSANKYRKPDSLFQNYQYSLEDVWIGYNIGARTRKMYRDYREDSRRRMFASVRFYDEFFLRMPKLQDYDYIYTNKRYVLGSFSWYRLNFYQTNYIYGFGRTEDLPVGFTRKIALGYSRIDSLERLYAGWQYDHYLLDSRGNYWNYTLALGTNYHLGEFQDNSLLFNISWFSRLFSFPRFHLRQFSGVSYAGIGHLKMYPQLGLNNEFGLEHFNTDSLYGVQRLTAGTETAFFTRWSVLGFKIGLFAFGKGSLLADVHKTLLQGDAYPALGGGIRTRNENLIFGTIECRFTWFPHTVYRVNNFNITVSSNLQVKYSGSFVQAPWFSALK